MRSGPIPTQYTRTAASGQGMISEPDERSVELPLATGCPHRLQAMGVQGSAARVDGSPSSQYTQLPLSGQGMSGTYWYWMRSACICLMSLGRRCSGRASPFIQGYCW